MTIAVAYKWAANPQDASVGADGVVDWSRAKAAVSEYDPVAVQVGRDLADALGVELVGVSVGTSEVAGSMAKKAAMSRGFDRGVLVAEDEVAAWNATRVAQALAGLVSRTGGVDLVLAGDASIDENAKIVPALVAGYLGWPCFEDVMAVEGGGGSWAITQEVPGGTRVIEVSGPVVAAVSADAAKARVPGMKDILAAGKKPVEGVAAADLGLADIAVEVAGRSKPESRARGGRIVSDAAELVAALRADGIL